MRQVSVNIQYQLIREDKTIIVYSPALEICGYGATAEEAHEDFQKALTIFLEETSSHGTLESALVELGWKKIETDDGNTWTPPLEIITNVLEQEIHLPAA